MNEWNEKSRLVAVIATVIAIAAGVAIVAVGSSNDAPDGTSDQQSAPQNTADSSGGPVLAGHQGEFTKDAIGCPSIKELDQLAQDAVAQDRYGFYKHMAAYGCLTFTPSETGLVIDASGFLPPYLKVRLDLNQRTYWFEDDPGVFVPRVGFRPGRMAEITQDMSKAGGACARGLDSVPSGQLADWLRQNCVDVPIGTQVKIAAVRQSEKDRAPLFGFLWHGKLVWLERYAAKVMAEP